MAARDKKNRVRSGPEPGFQTPLNHEQQRIQERLKQVRFQKTVFGGVNEADVWKKIAELNALYEAALSAERARYDALLKEQRDRTEPAAYGRAGDEAYPE